jgi:hypothetical protein
VYSEKVALVRGDLELSDVTEDELQSALETKGVQEGSGNCHAVEDFEGACRPWPWPEEVGRARKDEEGSS